MVWVIMRRRGVSSERRRSSCSSCDLVLLCCYTVSFNWPCGWFTYILQGSPYNFHSVREGILKNMGKIKWYLFCMPYDRSGSTLTQAIAYCLTSPSHYPNHCWLTHQWILWHSHVNNYPGSTPDINGNIFRVTGPLCGEFTGPGEFPAQRPVTRSFDVFCDLRPNKWLSKQPTGWWFETPLWSLLRQCNEPVRWVWTLHRGQWVNSLRPSDAYMCQ